MRLFGHIQRTHYRSSIHTVRNPGSRRSAVLVVNHVHPLSCDPKLDSLGSIGTDNVLLRTSCALRLICGKPEAGLAAGVACEKSSKNDIMPLSFSNGAREGPTSHRFKMNRATVTLALSFTPAEDA